MAVTQETLRRMIDEMGLVPVSDEEMERIVPMLDHFLEGVQKLRDLDLSEVPGAHVFRPEPER